jgi:hypothetical protein
MPRPSEIAKAVKDVEGFNAKLAVLITRGVGTMACAYVFALIALISLPDALKAGRPAIISWIAQTFLQLVLLSIIMVGQSVQAAASDARAEKEFADTQVVLDRLDEHTAGGIARFWSGSRRSSRSWRSGRRSDAGEGSGWPEHDLICSSR